MIHRNARRRRHGEAQAICSLLKAFTLLLPLSACGGKVAELEMLAGAAAAAGGTSTGLGGGTGGNSTNAVSIGIDDHASEEPREGNLVLAMPVSKPRGVCHDGTDLWVMEEQASIVRLSWPALQRKNSYTRPRGVVGDCAVLAGVLYYPNVLQSTIVRFDLVTGHADLGAFASPATRPRSVAADGDSLWISAEHAAALFRVSSAGELLEVIPNLVTTNGCDGLEATPRGLWCSDIASKSTIEVSKTDGSLLSGPFFSPARYGLVLIDDALWAASDGSLQDSLSDLGRPSSGLARLELRADTL